MFSFYMNSMSQIGLSEHRHRLSTKSNEMTDFNLIYIILQQSQAKVLFLVAYARSEICNNNSQGTKFKKLYIIFKMSIEDITKKSKEYQSKLLKYKLNIERYLGQNQASTPQAPPQISSSPSHPQNFGSSLFRALPADESLAISETTRPADPTLIFESNLMNSKVQLTKERNLLSEIDYVMNKIKSKGVAMPADLFLKNVQIMEKGERSDEKPNLIVNRKQRTESSISKPKTGKKNQSPIKPILKTSSSMAYSELAHSDIHHKNVKISDKEAIYSDRQKPQQLMPPKAPTAIPKLKQTISKYRQTAQQTPSSQKAQTDDNFFELSQTAQHRSVLSDLDMSDFEHEDSVLAKLYKEKEHLVRQIRQIDQEIFMLQME